MASETSNVTASSHLAQNTTTVINPQLNLNFINPIKLDRNNYLLWKTQVVSSIRANALEKLIDGTCPPPNRLLVQTTPTEGITTQMNPECQVWLRQDQALMSWLLSSMIESILGTITSCHNSREVWVALERCFSSQAKAKALQLKMQLQVARKGAQSVTDYYNKVKLLADNLIATGNIITNGELTLYILGGLGPDYDSVAVNLTAHGTMPSLEEVYSMLLSHESRLEQNNTAGQLDFHGAVANYAGSKTLPRTTTKVGIDPVIEEGVVADLEEEGITLNLHVKCATRFSLQGQNNAAAYIATPEGVNNSGWYFDSGATNHITNDVGNLSLKEAYKGNDKVTVGNGEFLTIAHIGKEIGEGSVGRSD